MKDLAQLREELAQLDRRILELVAERQKRAEKVGEIKQTSGLDTRDFTQEKEVVERSRRIADDLGLPPRVAEQLMRLLIRLALTTQERQRVIHQAGGSGRRVLVIGGAGQMGRWFVRFLASQGFEVEVADPSMPIPGFVHLSDWRQSELDQDVIVIATPVRVTREILVELARRRPQGLVFDISSLKSSLRDGLRQLVQAGVRVTSLHPMFGPDTELLSGRHIIFVDVGVPEATQEAARLFASTMARQVAMELEDHDRLIAYVLGLSHALNIAFFTALAESGEAAPRLARLSSTTFDSQLAVAASVAAENPHLYFEIQSLNDYGTESLSALLYAVERLRSVVRAGDEDAFVALMEKGRAYLSSRQS
ncbi:MAG: prephenate dehydrogenase/arogenate dehydrogenase family protein [Acidobacteriota bacterium]